MTEDEEKEAQWDKNRVYDDYQRHTGKVTSKISLPSIGLSRPDLDLNLGALLDRRILAVFVVVLAIAGGVYFDVADMLMTTPEEKAVNIADSNSMVEAYRQENGDLTNTVDKASDEVKNNLIEKGAISSIEEEIYVVDYTGPESNGVTAYVDLQTEKVVETDNNLRIG